MSERDTSRSVVRTYVPAYQKEDWVEEAEELDMSQSEFVRTMVQAGRRSFDLAASSDSDTESTLSESKSAESTDDLTDTVVAILDENDGPMTWDDVLAAVTDDVEARLDEALSTLQTDGILRYSGRDGGYVLVEEP
ncbi:DUF5805 domain-containing protein [Haloarchaeobius sp. HRN-SO-5]|uniref:DUF5805 domain-containing protein n=1 Tax=Haloarchaeobius sp. HRN-SO-5 TaxID=3446118 RepID=UPI003EB834B7